MRISIGGTDEGAWYCLIGFPTIRFAYNKASRSGHFSPTVLEPINTLDLIWYLSQAMLWGLLLKISNSLYYAETDYFYRDPVSSRGLEANNLPSTLFCFRYGPQSFNGTLNVTDTLVPVGLMRLPVALISNSNPPAKSMLLCIQSFGTIGMLLI